METGRRVEVTVGSMLAPDAFFLSPKERPEDILAMEKVKCVRYT